MPGAAGHWRTDTNWIFDLPRYIGDKTWIRQNKHDKTDARGLKLLLHGKPFYDRTAWRENCIHKVSKRIRAAGKAPTAPVGVPQPPRHVLEKKFTRIRDLRNHLTI